MPPRTTRTLLPDLVVATPACCRATDVLFRLTIPVPVVFLLLKPLKQQLVREASESGPGRSCGLGIAFQVDITG